MPFGKNFCCCVRAQHRPDIRHGDGTGSRLGWDVILLVEVRISPGEGKCSYSPKIAGQGRRDGWRKAGQN